jgi:predicted ATPase/transcriptional regulator with XRE-family HTH domain
MKQRRKTLDLTQHALADLASCSTATIEKIEADERRPSLQLAELLARALEIPEPEQADFLRVARGDRSVDRLAGIPFIPQQPPASNLPVSPTPLVGRRPELAEIGRLLADGDCRLLTLVGPGGIGKTRLALQAATDHQADYPDGAYFVPLVGVSAPEFVPPAVAESLALTFSGPTPPKNQILQYLNEKELLLVLDNFEHLLGSVDLVIEILNQACDVKMLVTSREPLGVQGEWLFEVQGLPVPRTLSGDLEANSAVNLFTGTLRRAGLERPQGAKELAAVVEICRLLGGMPLGIELAASWARVVGYGEIADEIRRNIDFLAVNMHGIPERHRSLRAVFDHSWELLGPEEQRVLQRLSVFRGGFTRQAAEFVAQASLGLLAGLVTKSLVSRTSDKRYELHEAVRQFAAGRMASSGELGLIRDRHCEYYLSMLRDQEQPLKSAAQRETIRRLAREFDNIREAWTWAVENERFELIHHALRCLGWFCDIVGWLQEGIDQIDSAVRALRQKAVDNRANQGTLGLALTQQGVLHFRQGYFDQAVKVFEDSLSWLRPIEDPGLLTDALVWSGVLLNLCGAIEQSQAHLEQGLACAQEAGDRWFTAYAIFGLGYVASLVGRYQEGYEQMLAGLARWRELGDPSCIALGQNFASATAIKLGYLDEAEAFLNDSLRSTTQVGDRWGMGTAYRGLGQVALARGDLVKARSILEESLGIFSEVVTGWDIVLTLDYLGRVSLAAGELPEAEYQFFHALRRALEDQTIPLAMGVLVGLGRLQLQAQAFEGALLLASFVLQSPASIQETRDAADEVVAAAQVQLSTGAIQKTRKRAAGLSLDSLATLIFSGQLNGGQANTIPPS